jgi:hypothetical protein
LISGGVCTKETDLVRFLEPSGFAMGRNLATIWYFQQIVPYLGDFKVLFFLLGLQKNCFGSAGF